jgi:hypothetical protein
MAGDAKHLLFFKFYGTVIQHKNKGAVTMNEIEDVNVVSKKNEDDVKILEVSRWRSLEYTQ